MKDMIHNTRPAERPPLVKPRRMIGPDCIKVLREFSLTHTGDKYTYDGCKVQRTRDGSISWRIQPDLMEYLGEGEEDTYGEMIRKEVIPLAEKVEFKLMAMTEEQRLKELDKLVRKAASGDGFVLWVLSTRSLRRLLFPAAYHPVTGKRRDCILYHYVPRDFRNATRVILLKSLSPKDTEHFTNHADRMCNSLARREDLTPVSLPNT